MENELRNLNLNYNNFNLAENIDENQINFQK